MSDKNSIWNEAGKAGLVLGCVSIAYLVISTLMAKLMGDQVGLNFIISVFNVLLWAAKFAGCIYLMYYFLKKFADANGRDRSKVFKYGMAVALLSALLYSAAYLVYVLYIDPEALTNSLAQVMESYSSMIPAEDMEMVEDMSGTLPTVSFFSNLIWCWLFGTVLSAIFSSRICGGSSNNPFVDEQ